jgi:hypothetical protein
MDTLRDARGDDVRHKWGPRTRGGSGAGGVAQFAAELTPRPSTPFAASAIGAGAIKAKEAPHPIQFVERLGRFLGAGP